MVRLSVLASLLLAQPGVSRAAKEWPWLPPPAFDYGKGDLEILVNARKVGRLVISWRAVHAKGHVLGGWRRKRVRLKPGYNPVRLKIGEVSGHRVQYRVGRYTYRVWANRGTWFSSPKSINIARTVNRRGFASQLVAPTDVQLAMGYGARVVKGKPVFITIGRTFGYETGYGVDVDARLQALTLVARGTVGPVKLTIAQRITSKTLQYRDYYLVLEPSYKRYVLPLSLFNPRRRNARPLRRAHSIAIRSLHPVAKGGAIDVSFVGLGVAGPHVTSVRRSSPRRGGRVQLATAGRVPRGAGLTLHYIDGTKTERTIPLGRRRRAVIPDLRATKAWICYRDRTEQSLCDPGDAPHSSFGLPPPPGRPVVIDAFDTLAHVNVERRPVIVFGSTNAVEGRMRFYRRLVPGSLTINFFPDTAMDYGGYLAPLPRRLPPGLRSLELELRGKVPTEALRVGIRDDQRREARLSLRSYLERLDPVRWQKALIPLAAFRAVLRSHKGAPRMTKLKEVSVTMLVSTKPTDHQIELRSLRMVRQRHPIAVARFDGERPGLTALGSLFFVENRKGAKIVANHKVPGKSGNGLRVDVSNVRGEGSFCLVALGLGDVDARYYRSLTFWVKGERGGEDATLYLTDGKRRAGVRLSRHVRVGRGWKRVSIPLAAFRPTSRRGAPRRDRLFQLVLAWEGRNIDSETIYFDELVLE